MPGSGPEADFFINLIVMACILGLLIVWPFLAIRR